MLKLEKRINYLLHLKYKTNERLYNINIIDNIIFNEKSHLVSEFKDFLILEDEYDFFKRYYNKEESKIKLKKFLLYYHTYSILFPNYSVLPESSIIYKNINLKQKMIDDMQNNNKKEIRNNVNENLDNVVFNSKVYDSIIKDTENCLSIFSYDKESNNNDNKEDDINELINKIDLNINNNKKEKPQAGTNLLYKSLNLNIDISDINNMNNKPKSKVVYTRKRTPNNSINSKSIIVKSCNNLTKNLKKQFKGEKEEINTEKNIHRLNKESKSFIINNKKKKIYKKINLNLIDNSVKINDRISTSYKDLSKGNSIISIPNTNRTSNKNSMISTNKKEERKEKKINDIPIKINLLKGKMELKRIKVNKKNINNSRDSKRKMNKQKLKINENKFNDLHNKIKAFNNSFKNKNFNKSNIIINTNLTDRYTNNNTINKNMEKICNLMNSVNELNRNRNYSEINFKENNNNKNNFTNEIKYIINSYNSKLMSCNTSIQFNNNNINIINSSNNSNNIINNIYGNINFNQSNDNSDFIHHTPYEKKIITENKSYNALKKNNKKNNLNNKNYFSSFNDNKRKKLFSKEIFTSIEKNNIFENNISNKGINSERLAIPFYRNQNNKIFTKINLIKNKKNDSIEPKYKTISNEVNKKTKIGFIKKGNNKIKNNEIIAQKKYLNITNTSINNLINEDSNSFLTNKIKTNNIFYNFCKIKNNITIGKIKKQKNYTFSLNSNNINDNFDTKIKKDKKKDKKDINELKEKRKKQIINQSNEQINQLKLNFLKKIENNLQQKKNNKMKFFRSNNVK